MEGSPYLGQKSFRGTRYTKASDAAGSKDSSQSTLQQDIAQLVEFPSLRT